SHRTVSPIIFACLAVGGIVGAIALVFGPSGLRFGIGDVEKAESKIRCGMTTDEVRSLLGCPHEVIGVTISYAGTRGEEWHYWETPLGGNIFKVHFGPDNCVDERYCSSP